MMRTYVRTFIGKRTKILLHASRNIGMHNFTFLNAGFYFSLTLPTCICHWLDGWVSQFSFHMRDVLHGIAAIKSATYVHVV